MSLSKLGIVAILCHFCFALSAQNSKTIDNNAQLKLYFDMGEQGGWVPFRTGTETGRPGALSELAQAMQSYSGIQFIPVNLPSKRAAKFYFDDNKFIQ